jgi:hypothetical protein
MSGPVAIEPWAYQLALTVAAKHGWRASEVYTAALRMKGRGTATASVVSAIYVVSDCAMSGESFADALARVTRIAAELYEEDAI